ncbi:hypothetical protein BJ684DRAFT_16638 [Piptocephalis cylindrospora]|uniref:NAD-dependent epimerase/dehydratase domain-containing protein n=1 Tax=Piptocephalis cylindrospora TaxID=1907219 RepID=A0A4P9Y564_9FUNG|nr:hypothetical protein BJ684DRAFT_16638 [Piptocephalis cylindrospora]|eukprot:RKP12920.1 hypothetical protein BJ684DRAFT_16638 [Piptocephalis cylindrospora]
MSKNVLIIGGIEPVGRYLVKLLVDTLKEGSHIRVVDRRVPSPSMLRPEHVKAFAAVDFIQANMANPETVSRVFTLPGNAKFDCVFNCAAAANDWDVEEVLRQRYIIKPRLCAEHVVAHKIPVYVHLSTGCFYKDDGYQNDESRPMVPLTRIAQYVIDMEEGLRKIPGLPLVLVRPAIPWGKDDFGLLPAMMVGSVLHIQNDMEWLQPATPDIRYNLVHLKDIARAMIHLAKWYVDQGKTGTVVYNVADNSDMNGNIGLLHIPPDADQRPTRADMEKVHEATNNLLQEQWSYYLADEGIYNSTLIPSLNLEFCLLHGLAVDGRAITRDTGFTYEYDESFTYEDLREMHRDFIERGLWPKGSL